MSTWSGTKARQVQNTSSGWEGFDYVAHAGQMTNSSSPHRPKSPQTSQGISCTAAIAQSLTRKALAMGLTACFLHPQHVVFPQYQRESDIRCDLHERSVCGCEMDIQIDSSLRESTSRTISVIASSFSKKAPAIAPGPFHVGRIFRSVIKGLSHATAARSATP